MEKRMEKRGKGSVDVLGAHLIISSTQGVAATGVPLWCHAVLDMYGKCVEISAFIPNLPPASTSQQVEERVLPSSSGKR